MSSGTNYPTALDLWVNKSAGDEVSPTEVNQWRSAVEQIERKNFPVLKHLAEITVANTTTETTIHAITVPANALGTTGVLEGSADIFINSMLNNATLSLLFYWGGTVLWAPSIINSTGVTVSSFGIRTQFRIYNRNSTSSQGVSFFASLPPQNLFHFVGPSTSSNQFVGGATKNTTSNQSLQLNVIWGAASASNSLFGIGMVARGMQ